jgi:VWFA-related protein
MRLVRRKKKNWVQLARWMAAAAFACGWSVALQAQQDPPKPPTQSAGNGSAPQAPPPAPNVAPLRVRVNLVLVPVVVRDSSGKAIGTLKREDFRVTDNKHEQLLTEFQVEESAKVDSSAAATAGAASSSGVKNFVPPERFTGLFIDDIHLDPAQLSHVTKALQHYLDSVNLADRRIGLLTSTGLGQVDFSSDLAALRAAVNKLRAHPMAGSNMRDCPDVSYYDADLIINHGDHAALEAAIGEAMSVCGVKDPRSAERVARNAAERRLESGDFERTTVLSSLAGAIKRMAAVPGQRTLVFVSPGFLLTDGDEEQARIIESAVRQKIIVNTLDSRGLYVDVENNGVLQQSNVMLELAGATGGTFFRNSNALDVGFKRLAEAPEYVYLLGFSPAEVKADGKFHHLKVELTNNSKLTISARRGYYAEGGRPDSAKVARGKVSEAVFSSAAIHDLSVQLHTQFVRGDKPVARFTVAPTIDLSMLPGRQEEGKSNNELNIVMAVFDNNGKYLTGSDKTFKLNWSPRDDGTMPEGDLPHSNFILRSGDYAVRVVVCEAMSSRMSAETIPVHIP